MKSEVSFIVVFYSFINYLLHRCIIPIVLIGVFGIFVIAGCEKPGVIGLDVHPESDQFNVLFSDTSTIVAKTVLEDSIRADEPILNLLGSYADPVFGYTAASFYTQFSMTTNNVTFASPFVADSLVLTIGYVGSYGPDLSEQTVNVYKLIEDMSEDSAYYSNRDFDYDPSDLAGIPITPQSGDSVITLKLNDPVFTANNTSFVDNAAFQSFFKGLYITTDTSMPGGILYLDLVSPYTKLTLYYNDSMSFDFLVDIESARTNRFTHDYTGTEVDQQLQNPALGDSYVYVQPMAGVKVEIQMPHLFDWVKNQNVAINKAELILDVYDDGSLITYPNPENLFILGAGANPIITDQYEGASFFGGTYDATHKRYSFNIARYIHEILYNGRENDGMYLIIPNNLLSTGSVVSANRVVIGGPKNSEQKMSLNLIYTIL